MIDAFQSAYDQLIVKRERETAFWVLASFLPTFLVIRALVYLAPSLFINIRGTHVHHLTWGILVLATSGYFALTVKSTRRRRWVAALYGFGLALAFDEFGMWLLLRDDYWIRQSYDAIFVITTVLINAVYFGDYWLRLLHLISAASGNLWKAGKQRRT